jgi:TonB family protein
VNTNQPDSERIRKYLHGELDARAMHQLERQAQDDPFLMEALEGYEAAAKNQQANLAELSSRLNERITEKKKSVLVLWRVLPVAAILLIAITIGWLWLSPKGEEPQKQQMAGLKKQPKFSIPNTTLSPAMLPKKNKGATSTSAMTGNIPNIAEKLATHVISNQQTKHQHKNAHKPILVDEPTGSADVASVVESPTPPVTNPDLTSIAVTQFQKEKTEGKITGKVTDAEGRGLPGARIIVKSSNTKVLSNNNGEFFLPADASKDSVTVQMMGYTTKRLAVNTTDKLDIKLDEEATTLAGVEVTHKMRPADIHDAQPQDGWKSYKAYLKEKAIMPNGETGRVKLKFLVDTQGHISNIRVIRGSSDTMNRKAIAMVENGPEWYGDSDSKLKEIKLKIKFHKSTTDGVN